MSKVPPAIVKKIRTLAEIADELRQGNRFEITRLTILKSLCSDSEAAAQFALYLARRTQQAMKGRKRPRYTNQEDWQLYLRLVGKVVRRIAAFLKTPTEDVESSLYDLLLEVRGVQNEYKRQRWGAVRIIRSRDVRVVEAALECILGSGHSSVLGYQVARQYAERYNSRYGTGLIPESAPMMDDIGEFWGRHFLGRGWRKRLAG